MTSDIGATIGPWLGFLAEWSLRWGVVLVVLALGLALRPPRRAAVRYALCIAALVAGVLIPLVPRWGPGLAWETRPQAVAPRAHTEPLPAVPNERESFVAPVTIDAHARETTIAVASGPEPTVPNGASWRVWPAFLASCAAFWVTGMLALLARLAAGYVALTRLRSGATAASERSLRLLEESRLALGVTRRADLAIHATIFSPVALGGMRPLVLVPADWETWSEAERRACLLHELAHLARHDDWAKLAQELIRAPFFFHPLVHWLLARLDRERELLCDEAVVAHDVDPLEYARVLLGCAQRPGRLTAGAYGLPFLNRGTVRLRIQRLLEDDMARSIKPFRTRSALALGVSALAVALGLGGLRVRALGDEHEAKSSRKAATVTGVELPSSGAETLTGTIVDPDGKPVVGATVVAGVSGTGKLNHQVFATDQNGKFSWAIPAKNLVATFYAAKDGSAPTAWLGGKEFPAEVERRLGKAEPFEAELVDGSNKPVDGAQIWIEEIAQTSVLNREGSSIVSTGYTRIERDVVAGSPLEHLFLTTTDERGKLSYRSLPPASWLKLAVTTRDGRSFRVKAHKPSSRPIGQGLSESCFVTAVPGETTRLLAFPAARVKGRVVSKLPGAGVAGRRVYYQGSRPNRQSPIQEANSSGMARTDEGGRFSFDSLSEGTINIIVIQDGDDDPWTCRAAQDVVLKSGATAEPTIELIRGAEVEGTVLVQNTGRPVAGAMLGVYGPYRPRSGAATQGAKTDAEGRYHYRLPAGETYLYVMVPPADYARLPDEGSSQTVTIPEGVTSFTVPPIKLAVAVADLSGRVLDVQGEPIAGAKIIGVCNQFRCTPLNQPSAVTDARGEFRLSGGPAIPLGQATHLQVRLQSGEEHELALVPTADGVVTLKVPALLGAQRAIQGPRDVAADELAGLVVNSAGKPLEDVRVEAYHWVPNHPTTTTNRAGVFRLSKLGAREEVAIRLTKEGYETREFMRRPTGKPGWTVVLGNGTYFEGQVLGASGAPVPGALIRADAGPMRSDGYVRGETITETRSGRDGRYRLYVVPGEYDIAVRVPGVGVARPRKQAIAVDEHRTLDLQLAHGADFEARVVDHETGKPVEGVRLWHWERPGIEGTSNANGVIQIRDLPPGNYPRFEVEAKGYARWWSDDGISEWSRLQKIATLGGWQRNFDGLDFDVKAGMPPVTIVLERGVTVTGRVLDPDGKPVAGATVAPALTGTGTSLTGDTRFSVATDAHGTFVVLLPASGDRDYNLVAHDGKYQQWRTWANGVLPPFRTKPGEEVRDVTLRLTRPATVTGRVLDSEGRPVANRDVRASAADCQENRYYDPTTRTRMDGTFELRCIRPGEQYIQVAPFWFPAAQGPEGMSQIVVLAADELKAGVDFRVPTNDQAR